MQDRTLSVSALSPRESEANGADPDQSGALGRSTGVLQWLFAFKGLRTGQSGPDALQGRGSRTIPASNTDLPRVGWVEGRPRCPELEAQC